MRRLDNLTNATAAVAAVTNNNNNMQITNNNNNNNNYIPNDTLQLDVNQAPQSQQQQSPQSFVVPAHHHHNHLHNHHSQQQNIRQPIAIPLVRKSPNSPQNYPPLPLQHQLQRLGGSLSTSDLRYVDNGSPMSRDSMSSPRSTNSSPGGQIKDEGGPWRPW